MPKDKLRTLVYNSDVNTLLQDGLEKVINGYTTFEEVIKLIELDDDIEDKKNGTDSYKYDLNKALEQTKLSNNTLEHTNQVIQQPVQQTQQVVTPMQQVTANTQQQAPITDEQLFKDDNPLDNTQILDI